MGGAARQAGRVGDRAEAHAAETAGRYFLEGQARFLHQTAIQWLRSADIEEPGRLRAGTVPSR